MRCRRSLVVALVVALIAAPIAVNGDIFPRTGGGGLTQTLADTFYVKLGGGSTITAATTTTDLLTLESTDNNTTKSDIRINNSAHTQIAGWGATGLLQLPVGTASLTALNFGTVNTGFWSRAAAQIDLSISGTTQIEFRSTQLLAGSTSSFAWASGAPDATNGDTQLTRDAAATVALSSSNDNKLRIKTANGAYEEIGTVSESLTIAAAATTDSVGNLLPANSYIEAVDVRVTTVIPTAVTFTVGDATIAARFATGVAVAANTTAVGLTHIDLTGTSGPRQTAAAKIRITPSATPAAATGVVRLTVHYRTYVAPTS